MTDHKESEIREKQPLEQQPPAPASNEGNGTQPPAPTPEPPASER